MPPYPQVRSVSYWFAAGTSSYDLWDSSGAWKARQVDRLSTPVANPAPAPKGGTLLAPASPLTRTGCCRLLPHPCRRRAARAGASGVPRWPAKRTSCRAVQNAVAARQGRWYDTSPSGRQGNSGHVAEAEFVPSCQTCQRTVASWLCSGATLPFACAAGCSALYLCRLDAARLWDGLDHWATKECCLSLIRLYRSRTTSSSCLGPIRSGNHP